MPNRWTEPALTLALLATLSGCAVPTPPPAAEQAPVPTRGAFAAGPTAGPATGPVRDDWLRTFDDPRLEALVREALANNQDLRIAAARRQEAQARADKAAAALLPHLDAGFDAATGATGGTPAGNVNLAVRVQWEADVWGRLRGDQSAAAMDAAVVAADYEYARQSLAAQVAQAWFVATAAKLQVEIDRLALAAQAEAERVTEVKRRTGAAAALEADLARANVAQARDAQARSQGAYDDALRGLEVLLGRYPAAEIRVAERLTQLPPPAPAGLPSELLERRPDLVAADRAVAAAFYRTGSARAAQLPRVALSGTLGTLLDPGSAVWNIGANLLAPVFDGGARRADVVVTEARQQQALAQYVKTAINAFREVETCLANEAVLRDREGQLRLAVDRLRSARDAARVRYDNGGMSLLDFNQVQAQFFAAGGELLRVQAERLKQRVKLLLSLGGSFDAPAATRPAGP